VYAHLRYDEIRSLPNESNTNKNGRLRPRLIDLDRYNTLNLTLNPVYFTFYCWMILSYAYIFYFFPFVTLESFIIIFARHIYFLPIRPYTSSFTRYFLILTNIKEKLLA
jgi:hypothetical protein